MAPYATLEELRDWVGITRAEDTADDGKLALALDVATALIDNYTDRYFTADATVVAREYEPVDNRTVDISAGISTTTGLIVETDDNDDGTYETTWASSDYRLEPTNAADDGRPWNRVVAVGSRLFPVQTIRKFPAVRVTAKGGWTAVPVAIKQACLIQAAFIWGRKDSRFGVAGSPEFGNELRVETALDRTAQVLLEPYRRRWWVA
jgi:hypothetical protein